MAAGCAILGISDNSTQEIIKHEHDGLLLKNSSVESLAETLEGLLKNSAHTQQLAQTARWRAQKEFSLVHMQLAYQQFYVTLSKDPTSSDKVA
jgi:glycosyltransferase involved in cell wall biosynthesis